ncbi:hypothetical protein B0H11DRAFT_1942810 [Mycena galericulata]|nr:hypothetical protein B0H11DRAFT_1942810 [Mycena galericulata]
MTEIGPTPKKYGRRRRFLAQSKRTPSGSGSKLQAGWDVLKISYTHLCGIIEPKSWISRAIKANVNIQDFDFAALWRLALFSITIQFRVGLLVPSRRLTLASPQREPYVLAPSTSLSLESMPRYPDARFWASDSKPGTNYGILDAALVLMSGIPRRCRFCIAVRRTSLFYQARNDNVFSKSIRAVAPAPGAMIAGALNADTDAESKEAEGISSELHARHRARSMFAADRQECTVLFERESYARACLNPGIRKIRIRLAHPQHALRLAHQRQFLRAPCGVE